MAGLFWEITEEFVGYCVYFFIWACPSQATIWKLGSGFPFQSFCYGKNGRLEAKRISISPDSYRDPHAWRELQEKPKAFSVFSIKHYNFPIYLRVTLCIPLCSGERLCG
jgi:hypothetical protein